jgi:hypothetical protein
LEEILESAYMMAAASYSKAGLPSKPEPSSRQDGGQRSFNRSRQNYCRPR